MPALERDIFRPFGFTPRSGQELGWGNTFLPVAELGYLRYLPPEEREDDGVVFEVDYAPVEGMEDADERLADASARHGSLMGDGRCRCPTVRPPTLAPLT
ncbi:MAG TPA: hypothetical protein VFM14_03350 [Gemmatimonadales bacterium]|nr:hypothetical protein [Gemmatimonadales bacterium]